jgi:hypothetical protein
MRLPAVAVAILLLSCAQAASLDVAFLGQGVAGAAVARDARFGPGVQAAMVAGGLVELLGPAGLGGGIAVGYEAAGKSALRDLVSYRGYAGVRVEAFAAFSPRRASPLAVGVRVGLAGSFLSYTNTEVYFVVPGIVAEPFVSLWLPAAPWLTMEVGVLFTLLRRADLVLAGSAGLSLRLGVRETVGAPRTVHA